MKAALFFLLLMANYGLFGQTITTIAGNGTNGDSGDGNGAITAKIKPGSVSYDKSGCLYIVDIDHSRVRKVDNFGVIRTVAGCGIIGSIGDNGPATAAQLNTPVNAYVDTEYNIYIADWGNHNIRKVDPSGIITTVVGSGVNGYSGDGGQATAAEIATPTGIIVDDNGVLYFSDFTNNCIRKVSTSGIISTIAGTGISGYTGDGGPATNAQLKYPGSLSFDKQGNLYFPEWPNRIIRKIAPSGIISTFAGNGTLGYSGDGGPATNAQLNRPSAISIDSFGNMFISDYGTHVIRKINSLGIISTIAGTSVAGYNGGDIPATVAQLNYPKSIAVDIYQNLSIVDEANFRVRRINYNTSVVNNTPTLPQNVAIYPNPANDRLTIASRTDIERIEIVNYIGHIVVTHEVSGREVACNVGHLAAGIYFVRVNGAYAGRFVRE